MSRKLDIGPKRYDEMSFFEREAAIDAYVREALRAEREWLWTEALKVATKRLRDDPSA